MAEETKQEVKQEVKQVDAKETFSTVLKVILGLVFLALGVWTIIAWSVDLLIVIRGCIGLFLLLAALITFAIAKE